MSSMPSSSAMPDSAVEELPENQGAEGVDSAVEAAERAAAESERKRKAFEELAAKYPEKLKVISCGHKSYRGIYTRKGVVTENMLGDPYDERDMKPWYAGPEGGTKQYTIKWNHHSYCGTVMEWRFGGYYNDFSDGMIPPKFWDRCSHGGGPEPPPTITYDLEAPDVEIVKPKPSKQPPAGYVYRRKVDLPKWVPPSDSAAVIGRDEKVTNVPLAPRPAWLPASGKGLANVEPGSWSMSIEQWIFFVRTCVETETWKAITTARGGEYHVTMYDVRDHFVVPWTQGTGCSIAQLFNPEQEPVELMLSHSWAGSVVETYNCIQSAVNHHHVPTDAKIFYCTFSMYQPEDGAAGGLTIYEQLERRPFAKIIESSPKYGMFVLHTTACEVYSRLWTVHEVDEAMLAGVNIRGLFDIARWTPEKFGETIRVETRNGQVGRPADKVMLEELIYARGGFDRLDGRIANFRGEMHLHLKELLESLVADADPSGWQKHTTCNKQDEWVHRTMNYFRDSKDSTHEESVTWDHFGRWAAAMAKVDAVLGAGIQAKEGEILEQWIQGYDEKKFFVYGNCHGLPLGRDSFPYGLPFYFYEFIDY